MKEGVTRILSLGGGVQSTALALMSAYGTHPAIPKIDVCIFADTWESQPTYRHMSWLTLELAKHGIPVIVTRFGERTPQKQPERLPLYLITENGRPKLKRTCTHRFKIEANDPKIRKYANIKRYQGTKAWIKRNKRDPIVVEHWFGISYDEIQRIRWADELWKVYHYPLVDEEITREDCIAFNQEHVPHEVPKSACIICPYRRNQEWRWLRDNSPEDWETACDFDDEVIRNLPSIKGTPFLHQDRIPLREVDIEIDSPESPKFCGACMT